jgi:hypothetical protein
VQWLLVQATGQVSQHPNDCSDNDRTSQLRICEDAVWDA